MSFDFFTLGGNSNWEDIFFYQKWRIQRHIGATGYRLLDPWDISRKEGSFEECRKKFVDYIEAYQLSRQKGHMVVMLHGLGDTKKIFRPLWRAVTSKGFLAAAINYPSNKNNMDTIVKQLDFFLNHLEDVNEVSFVTKGVSCLILRELFDLPSPWKDRLSIKKVLFVNPANTGSDVISWFAGFKFFRWIMGPLSREVSAQRATSVPKISSNIEQGAILCDSILKKIAKFITKPFEGTPIEGEISEENYITKTIFVDNCKVNVFNNENVVEKCVNFLEKGKFN